LSGLSAERTALNSDPAEIVEMASRATFATARPAEPETAPAPVKATVAEPAPVKAPEANPDPFFIPKDGPTPIPPTKEQYEAANRIPDTDPPGTVRLVASVTDICRKYKWLGPPIPFPPFAEWHQWLKEHDVSVHCSLEWKDANGTWFNAEMRSSKWDGGSTEHRVGLGQFPGTGYVAYGVYIYPGRYPRVLDLIGRPVAVTIDEVVKCDYRDVERAVRDYAAFGANPSRVHGNGKRNCRMGGPCYLPTQNSNTMVNYILRKCGVNRPAPERAVGWDTEPLFPFSVNSYFPKYENEP
jgi:hypothetical protein